MTWLGPPGSQPIQRSPWGLLVGDKVVGAESLMMQVPSGLRSFSDVKQSIRWGERLSSLISTTHATDWQVGRLRSSHSLLYPQSNLLSSVALRICTIDERSKLTDVLVERRDAIKHNLERLVRKSIFECKSVAGEDIAGIISAPKQKIVIT